MGARLWVQIKMLIWKNFVLQKRRPLGTFFEIFLPCIFFLGLLAVRRQVKTSNEPDVAYCSKYLLPTDYPRPYYTASKGVACNDTQLSFSKLPNNYNAIAFAPNTPQTQAVMANFVKQFSALGLSVQQLNVSIVGFATDVELGAIADNAQYSFFFGVLFQQDDGGQPGALGISGKQIHYTLRFPDSLASGRRGWATQFNWPFNVLTAPPSDNVYVTTNFVVMQSMLDMAITQYLSNNTAFVADFVLRLKQFPYPAYLSDNFIVAIQNGFPLVLVLAYLYTAVTITRELVREKELRIREAMKLMGLSNWVLWLTWFIKQLLFMMITITIVTIILVGGKILRYSNFGLVWIFLLLFSTSTITFCFMISTFISKASLGAAAGGFFFILGYVPYFVVQTDYAGYSSSQKAGLCIMSPCCTAIGATVISFFEAQGTGIVRSTMGASPTDGDDFTMNKVFGLLLFDTILYAIITWYIDAIYPGQYGVPKKLLFFFQKSYWTGIEDRGSAISPIEEVIHNASIEPRQDGLSTGVSISHLRKEYKNGKIAVHDLSFDMYEGQITALLGQNGAGKTTTMSVLVGLYPPTAGTAIVNHCDIRTNLRGARESLGFCPQFDIIFDVLTVEEHLYFFSRLKGSVENVQQEIDSYIRDLDLEPKRASFASTLSGGQKRCLSVGIAFCGQSKVVILDEPTSGMDPYKRRQAWGVFEKYKKNRSILLCTHFMDEADLLCDRIAILVDGRLRCLGSSSFLKNRFGIGYHLTVVKGDACDVAAIEGGVRRFVSTAKCVSNVGAELAFHLEKEHAAQFPAMFQYLDAQKNMGAINSYGISVTTMEDVFLQVNNSVDDAPTDETLINEDENSLIVTSTGVFDKGLTLMLSQFAAMFFKRAVLSVRSGKMVFAQLILPMLFVMGALLIANFGPGVGNQSLRPIQLSGYYAPSTASLAAQDTAFDWFSNASQATQQSLSAIGSLPLSAAQSSIASAYANSVPNDPRTSSVTIKNNTGVNVTSVYLSSSADFVRSQFFRKNLIGASFGRGAYTVVRQGTSCAVIVNGFPSTTYNFTLAANYTYGFRSYGPAAYLAISGDPVDPNISPVVSGEPGFSSYARSANYSYIEWNISPSRAGNQLYLHCGGSQGVPINITTVNGFEVPPTGLIGFSWYNIVPFHAVPSSVNSLSNAIAQLVLQDSTIKIYAYNYPLPKTASSSLSSLQISPTGLTLGILTCFGLGFMLATFAILCTSERVSKAKHIQFVSGVRFLPYWLGNFSWDMCVTTGAAVLVVIMVAIINISAYQGNAVGVIFFLFFTFGFSGIPLAYWVSFFFQSASSAYARLLIAFIFGGVGMLILVWLLEIPSFDLLSTARALKTIFMLHPVFAVSVGMSDLYYNSNYRSLCGVSNSSMATCSNQGYVPQPFLSTTYPGVGTNILFLCLMWILHFLALVYKEGSLTFRRRAITSERTPILEAEDEDVVKERNRIENGAKDTVNVVGLTKEFYAGQAKQVTAVNNLSIGLNQGECFGLLGVNGAGKTTTFGMLTGEIPMTHGTVSINGADVYSQLSTARHFMGYCPQYDGLIGVLTGREHLIMYARLHGITAGDIPLIVDSLLRRMGLLELQNKQTETYSGGNKRKLSTAIALIGDSPVIFLDEPSTGMDPGTRRRLWNVLNDVVKANRLIVLSSHSMEECEALCTRLAIMVNGKFQCIGSVQHIKSRFGHGYFLMAKVGEDSQVPALQQYIQSHFMGAEFIEQSYGGELHYQIKDVSVPLAEMFSRLEMMRIEFGLQDQTVSQTSLEQVFLSFAKHQQVGNQSAETTL